MLHLDAVSVTHHAGTPTEVRALADVSLHVPTGQFVTVVGANGSGKSTLLGVVAGSTTPTAGSVAIDGRDVTRHPVHRRARTVARVFDDPRSGTAPELSAEENLALALARGRRRGLRRAVTDQRRHAMFHALSSLGLGLEHRLGQPAGSLSAGQRQSLTMIMATMCDPSVLLLDEHLAALDPASAERVLDLTRRLVDRTRCTTVMVTHDMDVALTTGDRLLVMHRGRVAADLSGPARWGLGIETLVEYLRYGRRVGAVTR
jgi:putative ABC transport system ATP-binding protein